MVKLCYVLPMMLFSTSTINAMSTEYAKQHNPQIILSKENKDIINNYAFNSLNIEKRSPVSYSRAKSKTVTNIKNNKKNNKNVKNDDSFDDNISNNNNGETDEIIDGNDNISNDDNNDDTESLAVNSYAFKRLQKKLGLKDKKIDIPVTGPVPDYDDQFYENDGRPIVYQVDTEELKDIMDHYLEMGKEKWAGFLATSDCNKFQKLLKKIKKMKGNDDECETPKKPIVEDDCDDNEKSDNDKQYGNFNSKPKGNKKQSTNSNTKTNTKGDISQPNFANIPDEELESFQNLLSDVITYWEKEDASNILQRSNGLTYKDFDLDRDDEVITKNRNDYNKKVTAFGSNFDDFENYKTEDEENDNDEENEEIQELLSSYDDMGKDLFENMDPTKYAKTKEQKEWLKSNALRRARMLQSLLNGELDSRILKNDIIKYRDGNIFLSEDDNEFVSSGFKLQSTNLAMYLFFLVEGILFYLF